MAEQWYRVLPDGTEVAEEDDPFLQHLRKTGALDEASALFDQLDEREAMPASRIRAHRRHVPQLISRSDLDGERLMAALELTAAELQDQPPRERRPHTAIVQVLRVNGTTMQVDVVVPQWDNRIKVPLPLSLIPEALVGDNVEDLRGRFFLATVNTAADSDDDLYFADFRDAGPVPEDDDLER